MEVLPYVFIVLTVFGIWRPIEWSSGWRRYLYWLYSTLIIGCSFFFALGQMIYLVFVAENVDEMAESLFMLLTSSIVQYKIGNFLMNRPDIIKFATILRNEYCRPDGPEEIKIQQEFDTEIRRKNIFYYFCVEFTVLWMFVGFFVTNAPERTLPINVWVPFHHSSGCGYWTVFAHQICSIIINSMINTTYDSLFCGLIGQACAQLKILNSRLQSIPQTIMQLKKDEKKFDAGFDTQKEEDKLLSRCIQHHLEIISLTKSMNEAFRLVIFVQCAISTFVICSSIYMLSVINPLTVEFAVMVGYVGCMLLQIFFFCWYGNEVILESGSVSDAIYSIDWTALSVQTQKNLLMLMIRTLVPIEFTSGSILVLSLETYKSLVKLSYSIYNLLRRTAED